MQREFSLIKTNSPQIEKRTFPRFPFSYLTFKNTESTEKLSKTFEVSNISKAGMQLCLKNGGHHYSRGQTIKGTVQWRRDSVCIEGEVKWVEADRLGVVFSKDNTQLVSHIERFLSIENIISGMRALHQSDLAIQIPTNLKCWLKSDGPVEIFIWGHNDGELSRCQMILLDCFIEWEDGKGLKTGQVISCKDKDTPLNPEDEFSFQIDTEVDRDKLVYALSIMSNIPENFISGEIRDFLQVKLGKVLA